MSVQNNNRPLVTIQEADQEQKQMTSLIIPVPTNGVIVNTRIDVPELAAQYIEYLEARIRQLQHNN